MTSTSVCRLCNALRSGDFDMPLSNFLCFFHSIWPWGSMGMSWIGALLTSSCIPIAF